MSGLADILGAFEATLELERELGTRTVDCDRALLSPLAPAPKSAPPPPPKPVAPPPPPPPKPAPPPPPKPVPKPVAAPVPAPAPSTKHQALSTSPAPAPSAKHQAPSTSSLSVPNFVFIVTGTWSDAAKGWLERVIAAMDCPRETIQVVDAAVAAMTPPLAHVYIVLGSDACKRFAPNVRPVLSAWIEINGVPTVVTYNLALIQKLFGADEAKLKKAKTVIWNDVKAALAKLGMKPRPKEKGKTT